VDDRGDSRSRLFPLLVGLAMAGAAMVVCGCLLLTKSYSQSVGYRSPQPAQFGSVSTNQGEATLSGVCGPPIENLAVGNTDTNWRLGQPFLERLPGFLCERSARQRAAVSGSLIAGCVTLVGGTVYLPGRSARRRVRGHRGAPNP
jgi:hypothetical protein